MRYDDSLGEVFRQKAVSGGNFCMIFFHEPNLLYLVTKVDDDQMELKEAYL